MRLYIIILFTFLFTTLELSAQNPEPSKPSDKFNPVITAVPFLGISVDTRGKSMGDVGVATSTNVFSGYYNPSKYAYAQSDFEVGVSYNPWLHKLSGDISFSDLSMYKRFGKQVLATSLRYFNMGNVNYADNIGMSIGEYRSYDLAWDFTYARMLTSSLAMAVTARYIHSSLAQQQHAQNAELVSGNAVAADISLYQQIPITFNAHNAYFAWGVNMSNIGSKVSYFKDKSHKSFLPAMLRLGPAFTYEIDKLNIITFAVDITKVMAPSRYGGLKAVDENESKQNEISSLSGIFRSFADAPDGFAEEMREINVGFGAEYIYKNMFALRGGYFHEDKTKGYRSYVALGTGFTYSYMHIDLGYQISVNSINASPNSISLALSVDLDKIKYKKSTEIKK